MALGDESHGLPKWAWIAGGAAVVLALVLARKGGATPATVSQTIDPSAGANAAAIAASEAQRDATATQARASVFGGFFSNLFAFSAARDTNAATLQSNRLQADTAQSGQYFDYLKATFTPAPTTAPATPAARPPSAAALATHYFHDHPGPSFLSYLGESFKKDARVAVAIGLHV